MEEKFPGSGEEIGCGFFLFRFLCSVVASHRIDGPKDLIERYHSAVGTVCKIIKVLVRILLLSRRILCPRPATLKLSASSGHTRACSRNIPPQWYVVASERLIAQHDFLRSLMKCPGNVSVTMALPPRQVCPVPCWMYEYLHCLQPVDLSADASHPLCMPSLTLDCADAHAVSPTVCLFPAPRPAPRPSSVSLAMCIK